MPIRDYTLTYTIDASGAAAGFTVLHDGFLKLGRDTHFATSDLAKLEAQIAALAAAMPGATAAMAGFNTQLGATGATHIHVGDNFRNTTEEVKGFNSGLLATAAAFQGLSIAIDTIGELGEKIAQVRQKTVKMAEATMELRQEMRELANLEGKSAPDDEVLASTMEFGLGVGMTPKQATNFMVQYLGSNPAGLQKGNVGDGRHAGESQEDYEKRVKPIVDDIAVASARFGQRVGLQTQTAGDIGGVISQFERIGSGKEASQKFGQLAYGLNEGRGNLEPLMRVLANTAGAIVNENGGAVENLSELSVMLGIMSTHHKPTEAGTYVKKTARELRQMSAEGNKHGGELRALGVTPDMTTMQAIKRMAPAMKAAQDQGISPDNYLRSIGFKDEAAIQGISETYRDMDLYEVRMAKSQKVTGDQVEAQNDQFFNRSLAGKKLKQNAADEVSKHLKGQEAEKMNLARQAAITRMRDAGALNSTEQQLADKVKGGMGIDEWIGMPSNFQMRVDEEVAKTLIREARNAGLDEEADAFEQRLNDLSDTGSFTYDMLNRDDVQQEINGFMNAHGEKMLERGVDPFGGSGGVRAKVHNLGRSKEDKAKREAAQAMDPNAPKTPVDLADPYANRRRPGETRRQFEDRKFLTAAPDVGGGTEANDLIGGGSPDPVIVNPPMRGPKGKPVPQPADAAPTEERRMQVTANGQGGAGGSEIGELKQVLTAILEENRQQTSALRDGNGFPLMESGGGYGPERA